jgi:hypothetical protein
MKFTCRKKYSEECISTSSSRIQLRLSNFIVKNSTSPIDFVVQLRLSTSSPRIQLLPIDFVVQLRLSTSSPRIQLRLSTLSFNFAYRLHRQEFKKFNFACRLRRQEINFAGQRSRQEARDNLKKTSSLKEKRLNAKKKTKLGGNDYFVLT